MTKSCFFKHAHTLRILITFNPTEATTLL